MKENYAAVIVTYNRLGLLKECLRNVENQTVPAKKIIVVNNASTDGTFQYLCKNKGSNPQYNILTCTENIGGAGGFRKGLEASLKEEADCVLLIDDDAMIENSYMEKILAARTKNPMYHAFAGAVMTDGKIDTCHRRTIAEPGLRLKNCPSELYTEKNPKGYFVCDIASFCGMVIDREIIEKAGLPLAEYFIWCDDTEYSLRINHYSKFYIVTGAYLNHKSKIEKRVYPRHYDWRDYYAVRNRLLYVKKHGTKIDIAINRMDMFFRIVLRNWLFALVKAGNYDWKYEKAVVKKAYTDAKNSILKANVLTEVK